MFHRLFLGIDVQLDELWSVAARLLRFGLVNNLNRRHEYLQAHVGQLLWANGPQRTQPANLISEKRGYTPTNQSPGSFEMQKAKVGMMSISTRSGVALLVLLTMLLAMLLALGCSERAADEAQTAPPPAAEPAEAPPAEPSASRGTAEPADAATLAAAITVCTVPDPQLPSSAFEIFESPTDETGDYWVRYTCKQVCDDWRTCQVPAYSDDNGEAIMHGRAPDRPKQALAFVIDGMGGHLVFSEDGEKTVFIHAGAGGTRYYTPVADSLERQSNARTAMVRWEKGYVGNVVRPPFPAPVQWGWYSRTGEQGTTFQAQSRRVASLMAWVHENLSAGNPLGTMGCSMGTNATFMPVLWHGLDPIVDYQLFVGGPNMWDLNAQCGRRQYADGHCDLDGVTACTTDADCAAAGAHCSKPGPYDNINVVYDQFANHVHGTKNCEILAAGPDSAPEPLFDASSMGFVEGGDWNVDHRVDFLVNLGRETNEQGIGGDEHWALGDFMYVYAKIEPAENKAWHAYPDSNHCDAMTSGPAVDLVIERMGLR